MGVSKTASWPTKWGSVRNALLASGVPQLARPLRSGHAPAWPGPTGKTLQSIALLATLTHEKRLDRPHLVVVPLSVLGNWLREIAFWCPRLKTQKLHGNREVRALPPFARS